MPKPIVLSRINAPMPIYRDCTLGELGMLLALSMVACAVMSSFLTLIVFQRFLLGILIAIPISFLLMPLLARILQAKKVGKPNGYYQQQAQLFLEDKGLMTTTYLRRIGPWVVRR